MKNPPTRNLDITEDGVTVPIDAVAGEFVVRFHDGRCARSRAFERLEQASEFARFFARRQHWAQVAQALAARFVAPVSSFRVAPTTSTLMAFDCFLRAMRRNGASQANIGTVVTVLSAAFSYMSAGGLGALSAAWYREQDARSPEQLRTKDALARRRVIVANFLGWLAHQPLEPQAHVATPGASSAKKQFLTVAESEQLLRACPDDDARRYMALSLFAGLRPVEVAALRWEDFSEQRDALICQAKERPALCRSRPVCWPGFSLPPRPKVRWCSQGAGAAWQTEADNPQRPAHDVPPVLDGATRFGHHSATRRRPSRFSSASLALAHQCG